MGVRDLFGKQKRWRVMLVKMNMLRNKNGVQSNDNKREFMSIVEYDHKEQGWVWYSQLAKFDQSRHFLQPASASRIFNLADAAHEPPGRGLQDFTKFNIGAAHQRAPGSFLHPTVQAMGTWLVYNFLKISVEVAVTIAKVGNFIIAKCN